MKEALALHREGVEEDEVQKQQKQKQHHHRQQQGQQQPGEQEKQQAMDAELPLCPICQYPPGGSHQCHALDWLNIDLLLHRHKRQGGDVAVLSHGAVQ